MFPFRKSLGFRLLLISVILLALPVLLDSFILMEKRYKSSVQDAKNYLIEAANLRKLALLDIQPVSNEFLAIMEKYLKLAEEFPTHSTPQLEKRLREFAKMSNLFALFIVKNGADKNFEIVSSNQKQFVGKNITDFFAINHLFAAKEWKANAFNRISYDPITLQPYFIVLRPIIKEGEKEPEGFLLVTDTANLSNKLELLLTPDVTHYPIQFALVLPSSIIFAASDPSLQFHYFRPLSEEFHQLFIKKEPLAAGLLPEHAIKIFWKEKYFFEFEWENDRQLGHLQSMPNADFSLLAYASHSDIIRKPLLSIINIYSSALLILFIGGLLCYLLIRRLARAMHQLSAVMQSIQMGDLQARFMPDIWGYEINDLGEIFNSTVDSLLENKRKIELEKISKESYARELKLGQQVQRSLLLKTMPTYEGVELAAVYIPALEVGGDYYDLFVKERPEGDKLCLVIADASGKGVQACFYSLGVRSLLRMFGKNSERIDSALHLTNQCFNQDVGLTGMFITVWMADYDVKSRVLNYYSCGHAPSIIRRKSGLIEILPVQDVAMGLVEGSERQAYQTSLSEGDLLILYTDGITEAHNEKEELFGEERLIAIAKKYGQLGAKTFADKLIEHVTLFAGNAAQHDDITLLVMKVIE